MPLLVQIYLWTVFAGSALFISTMTYVWIRYELPKKDGDTNV